MRVTVKEVVPDGKMSLVLGEAEGGELVSFHVPRRHGEAMLLQIAAGRTVQADLPDGKRPKLVN